MLANLDSNTAQSIQRQLPNAAVRAVNAQNKKPEQSSTSSHNVKQCKMCYPKQTAIKVVQLFHLNTVQTFNFN